MLRLKEAQEVKYNSNLDGPEDTDYLTRYISDRNYYILNHLLYYYREFESLSYSKMINYTLNNLKRAYYLFSLSKMYSIKFFLNESIRLLAYIFLYPVFGSNFIVQKRGQLPLDSQLTEFDNTKKALFSK